jgi:hypothetical protein
LRSETRKPLGLAAGGVIVRPTIVTYTTPTSGVSRYHEVNPLRPVEDKEVG